MMRRRNGFGRRDREKDSQEVPVADRPADRALEFDSDQELEADLRRELLEIAQSNGTSDPEKLRDLALADPGH
jgi:hypothetical protein